MHRVRIMFVLAGLFFLGMQPLLLAQVSRKSFQADIVIEGTGSAGGASQTKIFSKDGKSRMESTRNGRQSITIRSGQKAYMYSPETNTAVVMSIEQANKSAPLSPQGNCNTVGQEIVDGRLCDVIQCDSPSGRSKTWFDKEIGYIIKSETPTMKMYLKNIIIDGDMDDSLFELPPGTKLIDMKNMMGQQGG